MRGATAARTLLTPLTTMDTSALLYAANMTAEADGVAPSSPEGTDFRDLMATIFGH